MSQKNHWENIALLKRSDEIKFVLADRSDYDYAIDICNRYQLFAKKTAILFSPVHHVLHPKELTEWILADKLPVRLNLQLHKYIWPPETRGV